MNSTNPIVENALNTPTANDTDHHCNSPYGGVLLNYATEDRADWLGLKNQMQSNAGRSDGIGRYQLARILDILQFKSADIAKHYVPGGQAARIRSAASKVNAALQKQIDEKAAKLASWGGKVDADAEMLKQSHPAAAELRHAIAALEPLPNPAEERKRADMEERRRLKSFRDYYRTHDYTGD